MKQWLTYLLAMTLVCSAAAQSADKAIRQGVAAYEDSNFTAAKKHFDEATTADPSRWIPYFNRGNTWYQLDTIQQATNDLQTALAKAETKKQKADILHNLGTAYLKAKQYEKSVEALKKALLHDPYDEDTRYNLAYAMLQLKAQQKQQSSGNNKQQKEEQQQDNQQQKKQQNQEQQQQQQKKQPPQKQPSQQQQKQQQMSRKQAQQLLQALEKEEEEAKKKYQQKVMGAPEKTEKDW